MFNYDIFISYASADRDWAMRLNESLTAPARQLSTFFDYYTVRAGDEWQARIEDGLKTSRHLIALWSSHAKNSDWVNREIYTFYSLTRRQANSERRLIFLNLQGENQALKLLQQISLPALQIAYTGNQIATLPVWDEVMAEIGMGLDPNTRPLPIPVVVLTLTRDDLVRLPSETLKWIRDEYRISRSRLELQYGPTHADWRPVGGLEPIATLLERMRIEIDKGIPGRRVTWREPEVDFWTDINAVGRFLNDEFLPGELSLLVIDPVAICNQNTYQRLLCFHECFTCPNTVIATLPPFAMPRRITGLKKALQEHGKPYFDDYFQPVVPPKRRLLAQCVWNASDADDIRRHLLAAAGGLAAKTKPRPRSAFLRHGTR